MRRFLPLLLILIIISPLSASRLRVGLYSDVPDFISGYVDDVISISFSRRVSSPLLDKINYERDLRKFENDIERKKHDALKKDNTYEDEETFTYKNWYEEEVEFVKLSHNSKYEELVRKGDQSALEYLSIASD
nr:hypothetical protein [Sphaerochaetaceae bacterium]